MAVAAVVQQEVQLQVQLEEVQGEVHQQHVQQEYCGSSVSKLWLTLLTSSDPGSSVL